VGILKQLFGICETNPPGDPGCWAVQGDEVHLDLARAPELSRPGGALRLEGRGLPERILLVHGTDGVFHAFRNRCTHMGRRIDPVAGSATIRCCSLSKSTFDYSGKGVSGPAKGPVQTYPVAMREGTVVVSLAEKLG
jgi:nitrite reductase/ring-hydroxylating ferredoxin subunit